MENVKLMNRTDTKFIFTSDKLTPLMKEVLDSYRILEVNGQVLNRYETLYYDTSDLNLYRQHHNGKYNRYKIRHRTYVESAIGFLEVKFKNNKGRTIKKRISQQEPPLIWDNESKNFLIKNLPFEPQVLVPTIWVNYSRYTLVNKTAPERLTIDLNLEFVKNDITRGVNGLVIAEVKQDKKQASPFIAMMKKYHIREGSISKYCMGIAFTCNNVKKNNFKQKLITINHLINYDTTSDNN